MPDLVSFSMPLTDAESGKKRKFAGSGQLLKILRLEKACTDKKSKQQNVHVARQHKRS
jgi:hypothetical protein